MPPIVASALTVALLVWLFRWDRRTEPDFNKELWIPFWWLFIACSREISEWFQVFGIPLPGGSLEEGNPVNRLFYIGLIVLGFNVLRRRGIVLGEILQQNLWLTAFLAYCFLSIVWSDYPFVSLKRWIKVIGHPIMALIILTEPNPQKALVQVIRKCAYIIVPVSVLFIKYYPDLGRNYSAWTGAAAYTGITTDKNALGINCLIVGFVLVLQLVDLRRMPRSGRKREFFAVAIALIALNAWLLNMADSKTPLVSLVVGVLVFAFCGLKWVERRAIVFYAVAAAVMVGALQWAFDIYGGFLRLLGKDPTLTDRTEVWKDLLTIDINPIIGTGFESFWLGERLARMWELWSFRPNQAHNGYLETYLNLGVVGLTLLLGLLFATFAKASRSMLFDLDWGRFRLGFLIAIVAYNWTEAAFKTTHPVFFMFYVISIDIAQRFTAEVRKPIDQLTPLSVQG